MELLKKYNAPNHWTLLKDNQLELNELEYLMNDDIHDYSFIKQMGDYISLFQNINDDFVSKYHSTLSYSVLKNRNYNVDVFFSTPTSIGIEIKDPDPSDLSWLEDDTYIFEYNDSKYEITGYTEILAIKNMVNKCGGRYNYDITYDNSHNEIKTLRIFDKYNKEIKGYKCYLKR